MLNDLNKISAYFQKQHFSKFIQKNFQFFVFVLVALAIPFTKMQLPYAMALWVLSAIFCIRKTNLKEYKNDALLFFPVLFYFTLVVGLFYSDSLVRGVKNVEIKLSLLFIPLVIVFLSKKVQVNSRLILKVFVLANFLASIFCLVLAMKNSIYINELGDYVFNASHWPLHVQGLNFLDLILKRYSNFSYNFLSAFHHPTYFSVYILFSIIIIIDVIRKSNKQNIWHYILIGYFTIFLWLLGSRAAYLSYVAGAFIYGFIIIQESKKYWIGIAGGILLILFLGITFSNKQVRNNIRETIELAQGHTINKDSEKRLWLWKSGLEVFRENLWFGVGTGDIEQELQKKYKKYALKEAQEHNYNVHNQYLDIAIKLGLFGLAIFLFWIFYTLYISIKDRQFLFFYFMLIMSINFFFEVMLNSIAGVSFFAFFYALLYSIYNRRTSILLD